MAKLRAVLTAEEHGALDEAQRDFYRTGDDGRFYLDADGVDDLPTVRGLKLTLGKFKELGTNPEAVKRKLEKLAEQLAGFGDLSADDVKTRLEELEALRGGTGDGKGLTPADLAKKLDDARAAVRDALTKAHEKVQKGLETEVARLTGIVDQLVVENGLEAALSAVDENQQPVIIPGTKTAVKALLRTRTPEIEYPQDGGAPVGTLLNDAGERIPIKTHVETWLRSDEARPFRPPSGNQGTGTGQDSKPRGSQVNPWKKETRNLTEQNRILGQNPGLAKQLAAAAGAKLDL